MGGTVFDRLVARVMWAVRRARRPGKQFNVEVFRRGPADGSILVSDAAHPARFVEGVVRAGRLPPGFHVDLDAFLAGP